MTLADTHFNATKLLKEVLKYNPKLQVKVSQFLDLTELPQDLLAQKVAKEGCTGGTWLPNELLQHYQEWLKSVGSRHKDVV